MTTQTRVRAIGVVTLGVLILFLLSGIIYWQAVGADMSNPRANFWSAVREGVPGLTTPRRAGPHDADQERRARTGARSATASSSDSLPGSSQSYW